MTDTPTGPQRRWFGLLMNLVGWFVWLPNPARYLAATFRVGDRAAGKRIPAPLPPGYFTRPSAPVSRYLYDRSQVEVDSIYEVHHWLTDCEYRESEPGWLQQRYLLPSEFESRRTGACAEHATWAWRQLRVLGIDAEFVVGDHQVLEPRHAWVRFEHEGSTVTYETTAKEPYPELLSERSARLNGYRPHYSIDTDLQTYLYPGFDDYVDEYDAAFGLDLPRGND